MTANAQLCTTVRMMIQPHMSNITIPLGLTGETTTLPTMVLDQGDAIKVTSIAGLHMVHIRSNSDLLKCVAVRMHRILMMCSEADCDHESLLIDVGCVYDGQVLPTGTYQLSIDTQLNVSRIEEELLYVDVIFEPIINEHVLAKS